MENDLTIQLRVLSAGIDKINSAKNAVDGLANSAKTASTRIGNFGKIMESTGSRMHVLGQRMTWMVTVPLLLLANKSIETALEMEKAFVSFSKVFSGTEEDFERLKKSAGEMSVKFGITIEEVTAVIREFNKTGIESTEELERLADMTAQVSKTFETDLMNAMEATKGLLMGYQLSIDDTYKALAALNIIGDQTAASEQGILDVFKRAAGTARSLGLGYRNLAGAQAALNKNNIEGSVTGTMLNFAMTRMAKPANAAIDAMAKFGINITSTTWKTTIDKLVNAFGVDGTYLTEFYPNVIALDDYSTDEAVQAAGIAEMINYIKTSGITRALYYCWNTEDFGIVKADGTYRLLWNQALLNSEL